MNEGPFLESTHITEKSCVEKPFLEEHCQDYNLSALSIVFGIGVVLAGLIISVAGLGVHLNISSSSVVGYSCVIIWFVFSAWLWASLVSIGKTNKKSRVSDAELIALQVLFFFNVFGHWLVASPKDKATYHEVSLVFEWCVIAFHVLYFLLALCVWVRLPLRSYVAFVILLVLAIFQSMN